MSREPDLRAERADRPQAPREGATGVVLVLAGLLIAGVVAAWLWRSQRSGPEAVPVVAPEPERAAPPAAPASVVRYPLAEAPQPPLVAGEVPAALSELLGAKAVTSFLRTDGFASRLAASIDSLGRAHSPSAAWPVLTTPGRFTVEASADGPVIAAENAERYTPFVLLAGTLDVPKAVALYRRMYPLLQQAYRELGFGERYLNDRVVEVIDLLLATPEPESPPRVQLTEVKGPVPSTQPWVRWQFADPELERLAAGQKILLRMGLVNERRLKAKLQEIRSQIMAGSTAAPAPASAAEAGAPAPVGAQPASAPATPASR